MCYVRFSHRIAILAGSFALSATTPVMAGCQSGSSANPPTTNLLSSGACQATGTGTNALSVGGSANATALGSTAIGTSADATASWSTSLGSFSEAKGLYATTLGSFAGTATAVKGATTVGANSGRGGAGVFSTAVGGGLDFETSPRALGGYSIAIGGGDGSTPFGKSLVAARSNYLLSIAVGNSSLANSDFAMAFGFNAKAGSGLGPIGPIAIGPDAKATLTNATALGRFSAATAANTTALGSGSTANQNSSVALGSNSVANVANTVSVGNANVKRRIMNVAPGVANSDAPTLGQVKSIATAAVVEALSNATVAKAVGDNVSSDLQRELRQMRSMIATLQQELAELKGQKSAALAER